jgi:branched-chain amino acid transport system permease protein
MFMTRSRFGRLWRAACDDPLGGIYVRRQREPRVSCLGGVLSGLLAATAGVLAAVHYGNISFETGCSSGSKCCLSPPLAMAALRLPRRPAHFMIGIAEALWSGYFPFRVA